MRLIDADAFEVFGFSCKTLDFADGVLYVLDKIDEAPTIEAELVRHGKWIKFHDELSKCSLCNYPTYTIWNQTDYCPNCGAKMDGGAKE